MILEDVRRVFPQFEKELLEEIIKVGTLESYEHRDQLIFQEHYINAIPLILKGVLRIYRQDDDGNEIIFYYVKAGETCANTIQCCENRKRSDISALAESEVDIIFIPIQYLNEWANKYRSWKDFLLINYKQKFGELIQTIDKMAFTNLTSRLLHYIQDRAQMLQSPQIKITHQQIAYELNSTREVISRLLKKLEKSQKIKLSRGSIEVL